MIGAPKLRAVVRFTRDVEFPHFSMRAGERWGFVVAGALCQRLTNIKAGKRFDFAGGLCLARDVELLYEGDSGRDYGAAMGCTAQTAAPTLRTAD